MTIENVILVDNITTCKVQTKTLEILRKAIINDLSGLVYGKYILNHIINDKNKNDNNSINNIHNTSMDVILNSRKINKFIYIINTLGYNMIIAESVNFEYKKFQMCQIKYKLINKLITNIEIEINIISVLNNIIEPPFTNSFLDVDCFIMDAKGIRLSKNINGCKQINFSPIIEFNILKNIYNKNAVFITDKNSENMTCLSKYNRINNFISLINLLKSNWTIKYQNNKNFIYEYVKETSNIETNETCLICLSGVCKIQHPVIKIKCGCKVYYMCEQCFISYIVAELEQKINPTCPFCRKVLKILS